MTKFQVKQSMLDLINEKWRIKMTKFQAKHLETINNHTCDFTDFVYENVLEELEGERDIAIEKVEYTLKDIKKHLTEAYNYADAFFGCFETRDRLEDLQLAYLNDCYSSYEIYSDKKSVTATIRHTSHITKSEFNSNLHSIEYNDLYEHDDRGIEEDDAREILSDDFTEEEITEILGIVDDLDIHEKGELVKLDFKALGKALKLKST